MHLGINKDFNAYKELSEVISMLPIFNQALSHFSMYCNLCLNEISFFLIIDTAINRSDTTSKTKSKKNVHIGTCADCTKRSQRNKTLKDDKSSHHSHIKPSELSKADHIEEEGEGGALSIHPQRRRPLTTVKEICLKKTPNKKLRLKMFYIWTNNSSSYLLVPQQDEVFFPLRKKKCLLKNESVL